MTVSVYVREAVTRQYVPANQVSSGHRVRAALYETGQAQMGHRQRPQCPSLRCLASVSESVPRRLLPFVDRWLVFFVADLDRS
jgi:hypothetical protein